MAKQKSHYGAKKRLRVTGSGKIMRERARNVHKFQERSKKQAARLDRDVTVAKADEARAKRLLGLK